MRARQAALGARPGRCAGADPRAARALRAGSGTRAGHHRRRLPAGAGGGAGHHGGGAERDGSQPVGRTGAMSPRPAPPAPPAPAAETAAVPAGSEAAWPARGAHPEGDGPGPGAQGPGASGGATSPRTVTVRLARFEGPLDLLLHLIKRDEIDIYDIPIAHITQQYLQYLELMHKLDLEVAGDFLVMAATLMRIKAKMLLPLPAVDEEEQPGDPREELVQRLIEYRQFKEAASTLRSREDERRLVHERGMLPGEDDAGPLPLARVSLFALIDALNHVLSRVPEPAVYEVEAEAFGVEDK